MLRNAAVDFSGAIFMSLMPEAEAVRLPEIAQDFTALSRPVPTSSWPGIDAKRLLDIAGACIALILCAPVMLMILLCLSDPVATLLEK